MRLLDLTLPTPAENLALDEAILEAAEVSPPPVETLRLWESPRPAVVVGRSSRVEIETRVEACRELGVPISRRVSGGAAVVVGPGCLMYALVLSYELRPELRALDRAHRFVLETIAQALNRALAERSVGEAKPFSAVARQGTSDLAFDGLKFSGNSVRCRRRSFLYHGTLLCDFPLELIDRCLATPPRMPEYRAGRPHGAFVANLPLSAAAIRAALVEAWNAREIEPNVPLEHTARLVTEKYAREEWNARGQTISGTSLHTSARP